MLLLYSRTVGRVDRHICAQVSPGVAPNERPNEAA